MQPAAAQLAPGTVLAGKYRVLRHLASGGMGAVYEVEHLMTGRLHALKQLYESLTYDETAVARFTQEARAATAIRNPHVVEVTDMGTDEGAPYLVMELLEGEDLGTRLGRVGRLPTVEAVDLVGQACFALAAAHALGIIHRDLKPENLFLVDGDFVKVLDFGIAKLRSTQDRVGDGLTRDGSLVGTPEYMSPEQITVRATLDHRADVYSLGVILYEALSGRLPFEAEHVTELAVKIATEEPRPLSTVTQGLPSELITAVHTAMARDPNDRPFDCVMLARSIAPFGSPEAFEWLADAEELGAPQSEASRRTKYTPRSLGGRRRHAGTPTGRHSAAPVERERPTLDGPAPARPLHTPSVPPPPMSIAPASTSTPPPERKTPRWALAAGGLALFVAVGASALVVVQQRSQPVHQAANAPARTPAAPAPAESSEPRAAAEDGVSTHIASLQPDAGPSPVEATTAPREPAAPAAEPSIAPEGARRSPGRPRRRAEEERDPEEAPSPRGPLKENPFL